MIALIAFGAALPPILKGAFESANDGYVDVIVRFKATPDNVGQQRFMQHGARARGTLPLIGGRIYSVPAKDVDFLAADPDVQYLAPDRQIFPTGFNGTPDYGWMTALNVTDPDAQLPYDGTGIGIAVIDSGITANDDLLDASGRSRVVYNESFVPGDSKTADTYGHGDHVAGLIAGDGNDSTGPQYQYKVRGIAPNAGA